MRLRCLAREQAQELLAHLRTHLDCDYAAHMVREIDYICSRIARHEKGTAKNRRRSGLVYDPLEDYLDCRLGRVRPRQPDDPALARCVREFFGLSQYQALPRCRAGRGRPTEREQDEIVRHLSDCYPPHFPRSMNRESGSRPRKRSGLFVKTVRMVLGFAFPKKRPSDIVDLIHRALKGYEIDGNRAQLARAIGHSRI